MKPIPPSAGIPLLLLLGALASAQTTRPPGSVPSGPGPSAPGPSAPASSAPASSLPTSSAPAIPAPATAAPSATLAQGLAALEASQPRQALAAFQQTLQADPQNATAAQLAATAALELYQAPLAVQYAEKAHQLDLQSWKIHTTLVAAYAAAGMKQKRDQERALLRQLHTTGPPDARQATGFLLEMFPVGAGRVDAVEEFEPLGKFHTYYRFLVRNADGRRAEEVDVQSNDFDQKSWAAAHPAQAAAGQRQFQIVGHSASPGSAEQDYRMFSGQPDYDTIRAMILRILTEPPPAA